MKYNLYFYDGSKNAWQHRMGSTPIAGTMIYVISMDIV